MHHMIGPGRRGPVGLAAVGVSVLAILSVTQPAFATITPTPVKTTPLDEILPSAGANSLSGNTLFAWSQNSAGAPNHHNTFVQINGGAPIKTNLRGTQGFGAGIDQHWMVFQEVQETGHVDSRLIFYDISRKKRFSAPDGINNPSWQFDPSISGAYVLYGENSRSHNFWQLVLHELDDSPTETILARSSYGAASSIPGQVSGDWVAFTLITSKTAQGRIHQITTGDNSFVPNPGLKPTYALAVTADGTAYFVRSGTACGASVGIYRWQVGSADPPVLLTSLAPLRDVNRMYAFNDGSSTSLYFDQFNCHTGRSNIYVLNDADTGSGRSPVFVGAGGPTGGLKAGRPFPGSTRGASMTSTA